MRVWLILAAALHTVAVPNQEDVFVGITMLNIQSISADTGQYEADFYLYFQSQAYEGQDCVCPYPEGREFCGDGCKQCGTDAKTTLSRMALDQCRLAPVFANSVGAIQVQAIKKLGPADFNVNTTNQYRVQGTFLFGGTDIARWPFETESLNITLEDPNRAVSELRFRPLPEFSGVAASAISPGWDVTRRKQPCPAGSDNNQPGSECDVSYRTSEAIAHPGRTGNIGAEDLEDALGAFQGLRILHDLKLGAHRLV